MEEWPIHCQQPVAAGEGMGTDQKVRKDSSRTLFAMRSSAFRMALICHSGRPPHRFAEMPVNTYPRFGQKEFNRTLPASSKCQEF